MLILPLTKKPDEKETPSVLLRIAEEVKLASLLDSKTIVQWPRKNGQTYVNQLLKSKKNG